MRFSYIYGHENAKKILKRAVKTKNVGHAYIFEGPFGVGKFSAALSFAAALLCPHENGGDSCGECSTCKMCMAFSHPDLRIVTNQLYDSSKKSENLLTDTIRNMKREIYQKPSFADRKIYIIPNADSMNVSAQNSLLKILEEPPLYCTIILIAQNASMFLDTILSRAVQVKFFPLSKDMVAKYLVEKGICQEEKAEIAASMADGSIGEALKIAGDEEIIELRNETVRHLMRILNPAYVNMFDFSKFIKNNQRSYKEIFSAINIFLEDIIKITEFNDKNGILMKDKKDELEKFAGALTKGAAAELMDILIKTEMGIEQNVNYSLSVKMMIMDFWEVIHDRSHRSKI